MILKNRVAIGVPKSFGLDTMIIRELEHAGFEVVVDVSIPNSGFRYKHIWQRLGSAFMKTVGNTPGYKYHLIFKGLEANLTGRLTKVAPVDYTLIIRPDVYPIRFIRRLAQCSVTMVGYQWDGLKRYPGVLKCIRFFDRFFAFDPEDTLNTQLHPITNFYPCSYTHEELHDPLRKSHIYYCGSYHRSRFAILSAILLELRNSGHPVFYILRSNKKRIWNEAGIETVQEEISYEENLKNSYNADVIIDIVHKNHKGLSFRIFEALAFQKKIITNNHAVRQYDFYHPDNIFIWDQHTGEELHHFINRPTRPISETIKARYSFTNWIRYALNIGPHTPIVHSGSLNDNLK